MGTYCAISVMVWLVVVAGALTGLVEGGRKMYTVASGGGRLKILPASPGALLESSKESISASAGALLESVGMSSQGVTKKAKRNAASKPGADKKRGGGRKRKTAVKETISASTGGLLELVGMSSQGVLKRNKRKAASKPAAAKKRGGGEKKKAASKSAVKKRGAAGRKSQGAGKKTKTETKKKGDGFRLNRASASRSSGPVHVKEHCRDATQVKAHTRRGGRVKSFDRCRPKDPKCTTAAEKAAATANKDPCPIRGKKRGVGSKKMK